MCVLFFFSEGHYSVAKLILDSNAEVNVPSGSENNIPLTLACWKGIVSSTYYEAMTRWWTLHKLNVMQLSKNNYSFCSFANYNVIILVRLVSSSTFGPGLKFRILLHVLIIIKTTMYNHSLKTFKSASHKLIVKLIKKRISCCVATCNQLWILYSLL